MVDSIVLVPVAFFAFLVIVLIVPAWLRHRLHTRAIRMIEESAAQGRAIDPKAIQLLLAKPRPAVGKWFALLSLLLGVPSLCIGVALTLSATLLGGGLNSGKSTGDLMVGAFVNLCIGVGLITLGLLSKRRFASEKRSPPKWDYAAILALVCFFLGTAGFSIATGLALSSLIYVMPLQGEKAGTAILMGALVNACSGIGFLTLGTLIFRWFVERTED